MPCALCKMYGHNKKTCKKVLSDQKTEPIPIPIPILEVPVLPNCLELFYKKNKSKMYIISPIISYLLQK